MVPGDRDVDETLEEILLFRLGRAPGLLELLVRLEVLAPPDQVDTVLQPLGHKRECYARRVVATILLEGVDLFIRGKLEASLQGHHLVTSDSVDPPDLVIADVGRTDPDEVADAIPTSRSWAFRTTRTPQACAERTRPASTRWLRSRPDGARD